MSGLVGYFSRRGNTVQPEILGRMTRAVSHRGASGWESVTAEGVGIAAGQIARANHDQIIVAGDVRLDNRSEVCKLLGLPDAHERDIELVSTLRRKYGDSFIDHIRGDFAFVFFDTLSREVVSYRDHFGVRPFCYALGEDYFIFGSELQAILASGFVADEVDVVRVEDFLIGRLSDQERTFYRRVKRLQPATEMRVTGNEAKSRSFWSIDGAPMLRGSEQELISRFRELFLDAVRVRAEDNLSCMLSGGLDSSSVVASAALLSKTPAAINSYSVQFPYLEGRRAIRSDESEYARTVVDKCGVTGNILRGDTETPLGTLSLMTKIHGQPFEVPNAYLDVIAMKAVKARGGNVLLTGLEGDLTISHGDGYLLELGYAGDWNGFVRESQALIARSGATRKMIMERYISPVLANRYKDGGWAALNTAARSIARTFGQSAAGMIWQTAFRDRLSDLYHRIAGRESFEDAARLNLIRKDYRGRAAMIERIRRSENDLESARTQRDHHVAFLKSGYSTSLLEFSERNAAFFGLDIRHPFFDTRLVEFSVGLPGSTKLHDGWTRYILRLAMEQILPSEVQWRVDKAVLAPNFIHLMREESPEKVQKLALTAVEAFPDILDKAIVNSLLERRKYATLWNILSVGEWVLHKRN